MPAGSVFTNTLEALRALELEDDFSFGDIQQYIEKLSAYAFPRNGDAIERDRLQFYINRAMQTCNPRKAEGEHGLSDVGQNWLELGLHSNTMGNALLTQAYRRAWGPLLEGVSPVTDSDLFEVLPTETTTCVIRQSVMDISLAHVDQTKSPGLPYTAVGQSQVEQVNKTDLKLQIEEKLTALYRAALHIDSLEEDGEYSPAQDADWYERTPNGYYFVRRGCCDPFKLHIKTELTKQEKIARLINGACLADRIIIFIFFGDALRKLPESYEDFDHGSAVGIDLNKGAEFFALVNGELDARARSYPPGWGVRKGADDAQGWEFVCGAGAKGLFFESYKAQVRFRGVCLQVFDALSLMYTTNQVVATTGGAILQLPISIMPSGVLITHLANSVIRSALADACLVPDITRWRSEDRATYEAFIRDLVAHGTTYIAQKANGDDLVGLTSDESAENHRALGLVVTSEAFNPDGTFGYCSQLFTSTGAYPETLRKSLANFSFKMSEPEIDASYRSLYANIPSRDSVFKVMDILRQQSESVASAH